MNTLRSGFCISALLMGAAVSAQGQQQQQAQLTPEAMALVQQRTVSINPNVVVFTPTTTSIPVEFVNPSDSLVVADVSIEFAAPQTNAAGMIVDSIVPASVASPKSLVSWVQGLPQQVKLAPHEKQTVNLTVNVPKGIKDGEYYGRVVVIRNNVAMQLPAMANGAAVTVNANLNLRFVAQLLYRQGTMATGLEVSKLAATTNGNAVRACMVMHHTGTAHFEGVAHLTLRNEADKSEKPVVVAPLTVYDDLSPCLDVGGLAPGKYTLLLSIDGERQDIPASVRLPVTPVTASVPFEITGPATATK